MNKNIGKSKSNVNIYVKKSAEKYKLDYVAYTVKQNCILKSLIINNV